MKSKTIFWWQFVMMMVLLMCGTSPSWAYNSNWNYSKNGGSGDGSYVFRYDSKGVDGDFMGLNVNQALDANTGNIYYLSWKIKVNHGSIDGNDHSKLYVTIEYANGNRYNIATAEFDGKEPPSVSDKKGKIKISNINGDGWMTIQYQPTPNDLNKGLRKIYFQVATWWSKFLGMNSESHNFQYEKPINISAYQDIMPTGLNAEYDGDGNVLFKVSGARDFSSNNIIKSQYLSVNEGCYYHDGLHESPKSFVLDSNSKTGGSGSNVSYVISTPVRSYTVPTRYFDIYHNIALERNMSVSGLVLEQQTYKHATSRVNYSDGILIKPYTRPMEVVVEFDKWTKKNVVTWKRKEKAQDRYQDVDCLTDGTWYVLRYEKGQSATDYTVVDDIPGKNTNLKVADTDIEYDKEYVYRVVFLPDILEQKYSKDLIHLPGQSEKHNNYDLFEEAMANTTFDLPIKLAQDLTSDKKIRIVWDYSVQGSGFSWNVEKRKSGETTWMRVDNLPIDSKQSQAAFVDDENASVCNFNDYRITTTVNDKEFTSNTLSANLPAGSYISSVVASTGTESNHVVVKWTVERPDKMHDIHYRVKRRIIGSDEWILLNDNDDIHGTASEYSFTDNRVMAGSYYEYTVEAYGAACDEQLVKISEVVAPGFSQARGTITGHIAYGTGTAVPNTRVNLVMSSGDDVGDHTQFLSRYIDGEGKGLQWMADSANYVNVLNGKKALSLQMWVRPTMVNGTPSQSLVRLAGALELGLKSADGKGYYLYGIDKSNGGTSVTDFPELVFSTTDFTHVAAVYGDGGKWTFYVGTDTLRTATMTVASTDWNSVRSSSATAEPSLAFGGSNGSNEPFTGYVDDIRLWNRALSEKELQSNYTRILGGRETGLFLYWPLDEGINVTDYAFDVACLNGIYQQNHPVVGVNTRPSTSVPSKLKLYGMTDSEGDYIIRGIPFQEGGTNYKVVPELGIHEFSPNMRSMFVSPTSLTANNIDFEDVSSFPMEGYVYYAGTSIPAEGIMFHVDGNIISGNGEIIKTDANGHYLISVPIGKHYVEAKLDGHTMVSGGRFPTEGTYDFNDAVTYDFADSTLVNFVGRVGGGTRCDTLAVGFGATKNNIGIATLKLGLNNESLSFNCLDDHITSASTKRFFESDTTSIQSQTWTGIDGESHIINIRTDSLTGEFSAMLPPLKYVVQSVRVDKNQNIEFNSLSEIDLTNPNTEMSDSLRQRTTNNDSIWVKYKYNTKKVFTYYSDPKVKVVEIVNEGGAFGEETVTLTDSVGNNMTTPELWSVESDGKVNYLMEHPVYKMGASYEYDIFGYEEYVNYDSGTPVSEIIPLNGQEITIANEMSDKQSIVYKVIDPNSEYKAGQIYEMESENVQLGGDGHIKYRWGAGAPNIVAPYTRHFRISMNHHGRHYIPMEMDAIVLGQLTYGNNFVTRGPNIINYVLRDPYGAKSTTTLKKGKTVTTTKFDTYERYGDEKLVFNFIGGSELRTGAGVGVMLITGAKVTTQVDVGMHASWEYTHNNDKIDVVTTMENVSTGSSYPYVGSAGDVFVGLSTNFLMGPCRNLFIDKDQETGKYVVKLEDAFSVSDSIATAFKYSQYEIETVMIPKWKDMRRNYLIQVRTENDAKNYVNNGDNCLYVTWMDPDSIDFSKTGDNKDYKIIPPKIADDNPDFFEIDSVLWCTEQIDAWIEVLSDNEENKVLAMRNQTPENFSIDGGSSYTYTTKNSHTDVDEKKTVFKIGGIVGGKKGFVLNSAKTFGIFLNLNTENGGGGTSGDGTKTETSTEWDYVINDGNRDTDLSINVYKSKNPKYSDFFSVFGGQTYNPYQPQEVTQHYKPGTEISKGTQQMEQPNLKIGIGDQLPSKHAVVNDIPSGQSTNVNLYLSNMANAHQGLDFTYNLIVFEKSNTKGLQILMDGVPINGRSVKLQQGETISKVITIQQTDQSILNYDSIRIRFTSQYQAPIIYDEVMLSAHFVPSSSPIDLVIEQPVINANNKEGLLDMKLKNFNRNFKGLSNVGVQYRYESSQNWTTLHTWVVDKKQLNPSDASIELLPAEGNINFSASLLSDVSYPEGTYSFRAFTSTLYGNSENTAVQVYSNEVTVVKDMTRPRNLTTPTPTNGILNYGDDISIEFNEDIVPGYVRSNNVIVTARLNERPVNHDVALQIVSQAPKCRTRNPIFLTGSFSIDFWLKWTNPGTILQRGMGEKAFTLNIDNDHHVRIRSLGNEYVSEDTVPKNEWIYMVLSYDADKGTFSMIAQSDSKTYNLFDQQPFVLSSIISYSDDNYLYINLNTLEGAMHDLGLFNIYRNPREAAATRYQTKDTYVYGLANYWPMNEGHGTVVADARHTHDFDVHDTWKLSYESFAPVLEGNEGFAADISTINTGFGDSYAIEMWLSYLRDFTNATVFETGTDETNKLRLHFGDDLKLWLDYGKKTQMVADLEEIAAGGYGYFNHIALNVLRGQAASFYCNGKRTAVIEESEIPPVVGSEMKLGEGFLGTIDEVRYWRAAISESRLLANIYNSIDTTHVYSRSLAAYYPFEKTSKVNGVNRRIFTLDDMAPGTAHKSLMKLGTHSITQVAAPIKRVPEETTLITTPVASERKVVINLTGAGVSARDIEGTTLNITVDKIFDMHGNESQPIHWTALVQKNPLKWTKDSVNIIKKYGDSYTFDVDIENKGSFTEYYSLKNLPQWLSIVGSETSGELAPISSKTLRFRVDPLVRVGNYDLTLRLQGNDEILEPLRVGMKVSGEEPNWNVNPTLYEHQMTIIGQVQLGGFLLESADSRVAAFINGECRGVASPEKVYDVPYVTMTIYGDSYDYADKNKPITFRIWDASTDITYPDVNLLSQEGKELNVTFVPDTLIGDYQHPAIWIKGNKVEQNLKLNMKWNWIALGVVPEDLRPIAVFPNLTLFKTYIKDKSNAMIYSNGSEWKPNSAKIEPGKMYKMMLSNATNSPELPDPLPVWGVPMELSQWPVHLNRGWNWIGYTPLTTMNIDEALAGANPQQGDRVKSLTGIAIYDGEKWNGSLKSLESGHGYMYFNTDTTQHKQFVYPTISSNTHHEVKGRNHDAKAMAPPAPLSIFSPVEAGTYSDNMTMVIQLMDGEEVIDTCEVAAFVNGECRGATRAEDGLYYLIIAGEGSGQAVEIRTYTLDGFITLDNRLTYATDQNIGTPWEPYVIDLSNLPTSIHSVTADDDTNWWTLQGYKIGKRPLQPGVYIHNGRKVVVKAPYANPQ